eukprot:scaffold30734_cov34-Cyclotella_meneghiniana.AAC.1
MANVCFHAQVGELSGNLDSCFGFDGIDTTINLLGEHAEVCFVGPAFRRRAVSHAEDAIFWVKSAGQNINPHCDDAGNMFEEVVGGSKQQPFREVESPGVAFV